MNSQFHELETRLDKKFNKINIINQHIVSMLNRVLLVFDKILKQINTITIKILNLENNNNINN
jgi:hypothetical protein